MTLTFANYKQVIPQQVLTKARDYYRKGHIVDLSYDEDDQSWEGQVEGTDLYDVRVEQTVEGNLICTCTCPYDYGEHCKHIAAMLYAIEDSFHEEIKIKPRKKSAQRKTRHDKLRELLEKTTHTQLITVLLDLAQQDREVLNQLMIRFDSGNAKPMDYRRVVKDALRLGRGDYGYIDYMGAKRAAQKIENLLDDADKWRETGDVDKAVSVYQAVISEVAMVYGSADDSDGGLGGVLSLATEGLSSSIKYLSETQKDKVFDYVVETAWSPELRDTDQTWELLYVAEAIVDNPIRRERLMVHLASIEADLTKSRNSQWDSDYGLTSIAVIKLAMIEKFDETEVVESFLQSHVHLHEMRKRLIDLKISKGKLSDAMLLIHGGIEASKKGQWHGLVRDYELLKIKLLETKGEKSELIQSSRSIWLEYGTEDVFKLLKKIVPASEWQKFVEGLIGELVDKNHQLAWLYAEEKRWQDLMTLVQAHPQAHGLLDSYRKQLESRFPEAVATIYEDILMALLPSSNSRSAYQYLTTYLKRIKTMGQSAKVKQIITRIKSQYPKRIALHDELKKI